jgi:Dictyostelium (slime mold) repeat
VQIRTTFAWLATLILSSLLGCSVVNSVDDPVPPGTGGGGTGATGGTGGTGGAGGMAPDCDVDADCMDDGDNCTIESCDAGSCSASTTDPDDGDPCTDDSCDADGVAENTAVDPDDMDPCTIDSCGANGVQNDVGIVMLEEPFDVGGAMGWTADAPWELGEAKISGASRSGGNSAVPGQWVTLRDPGQDHTDGADNGLAGVVIGGFAPVILQQSMLPFQAFLTSPEFDGTAHASGGAVEGRVLLSYWRVLISDYDPYFINTVEVKDAGNGWVELFNSGMAPGFNDQGWHRVVHDITDYAHPTMQVRFGFTQSSTGAFADSPSWSVDDVQIINVAEYAEDNDACTVDQCVTAMGGAVNVPIDPTDMNPCTTDVCDPKFGPNNYDTAVKAFYDFSSANGGVSLGGNTAAQNFWQVGPATAGGTTDPGMDTSPTDDNGVAGINIGGDYDDIAHPFIYLTTGFFDGTQNMPAMGPLEFVFQRWLNSDYPPSFATNTIDVLPSGSSVWVNIWTQPANSMFITDTMWMPQMFDLSAFAGPNMRLRFGFAVFGTGAIERGGWNIDDLIVRDMSCPAPMMP